MIRGRCDFCGKDSDRTAMLISMTPFQNFDVGHSDIQADEGKVKTRVFAVCNDCLRTPICHLRLKHNRE